MTDETSQSTESSCIDRRTLLGAMGGGLAALAGCSNIGGSSNGTAAGPTATQSPSSKSDVLKSLTFEPKAGVSPQVTAHFKLAEDSMITRIALINGMGNEVNQALISARETVASFVVARLTDEPSERITQGQNTLVLIGEQTEVEIPVTYSASLELRDVIGPDDSTELPPPERDGRRPIGLLVENTGQHADIARQVISKDGPHLEAFDSKTSDYTIDMMVKPGSTKLLPVRTYLAEIFGCPENHTREATLTLKPAFSEPITFTQTFSYSSDGENSCELSLNGEQSIVERTKTGTQTE
ncbi:hypothetical protein KTS45_19355 [Halomicroarcula limicola]|uniref:Uncharacterized protein n=1 Tax=Haloarcula limicola TaxID=1429915 RepID=A0A8J8C6M4_9EURY|nr:hypothetical protein [Halomicroarcula limicola]MBV0926369.1 hypothetical protein [Halomicroarcula limicola]